MFSPIFSIHFDWYRFIFLHRKNINPILKYLVFIKRLKKWKYCFVFMHTTKSLKAKIILYFHTPKKLQKKNSSYILVLITSLLKSREFG
jgi:hypothetical protein